MMLSALRKQLRGRLTGPVAALILAPMAYSTSAADSLGVAVPDSVAGAPAVGTTALTAGMNERLPAQRMVRLTHEARNVIRAGPGDAFAIVGVHPKGAEFPVLALRDDWYNVRISTSETGWIHRSLCQEFDDLSDLRFRPNPRLYSRTGSIVLSAYGGAYAFDRKSNSLVLGSRVGYYVFDWIQAEAGVAWTRVQRPAEIVESLFGLSLEAEDFDMLFYHLDLIVEVLPGRQMVPYVVGGAGSSILQGRSESSFNFGAGTTLFLSKRTAMRWEVRNYVFEFGSDAARRTNNNIEFTQLGPVLRGAHP
jgi:outer membrane beta-barrel protein